MNGSEAVRLQRTVVQVCDDCLDHPELLRGCNVYVQQVCAQFGYGDLFAKGDNADGMIRKFKHKPFNYIGTDKDKATKFADDGYLVLGGLTLADMLVSRPEDADEKPTMGHVVVVAPGGPCKQKTYTLANGKTQPAAAGYPYCYGGAAKERYRLKEMVTISLVMPKASRDKTQYTYLEIPKK